MTAPESQNDIEETEYALSFYHYCFPKEDIRCKIASEIKNVVPVVMFVIGFLGNTTNVIILSRKKFRNHPFLFGLVVLSVSDTIQLLLNVLSIHVIQKLDTNNMYKYCNYDGLATMCQGTFSCYILAILTLDRTLYMKYPHKSKKFLTKKVYIIVFMILLTVIVLFHVYLIFGGSYELPHEGLRPSNYSTEAINMTTDPVAEDRLKCIFVSMKHGPNRPFLMLLMVFLDNFTPLVTVCVGNILIIRAVKESQARVGSDRSRDCQTQDTATKIAKTVCVFFFVSTSPLFISKLVQGIMYVPPEVYPTTSLIDMILYVFAQCNFGFNFIMYFWTGSVFREECKIFLKEIRGTINRLRT